MTTTTTKGRKFPAEILTPEELSALLSKCSRRAPTGIRDRALITLLYRTGLRIAEALALRPSDVDMTRGTVRVLYGKGNLARTVGIGDGALAVIQLWLDCRHELGIKRSAKLFCTLKGTPLLSGQVRMMLKRRAAKANIDKRVHPHMLRHSHTYDLAMRGVPVNVIQKQLGHAWLNTTQTYLDHVAPADVIALGRSDVWTDD